MNKFNIQFHKDFNPHSGTKSFTSWSKIMDQGIKQAVGLKVNEKITGMEISENGIKVHIKVLG